MRAKKGGFTVHRSIQKLTSNFLVLILLLSLDCKYGTVESAVLAPLSHCGSIQHNGVIYLIDFQFSDVCVKIAVFSACTIIS